VSEFSEDWLRLREPFDHAARDAALGAQFAAALPSNPRVVELGGGLGSGVRWLAQHVAARWLLVDHDPALLTRVTDAETRRHDLRDLSGLDLAVDGVSCQALLDLGSAAFLGQLADWVAERNVPVLAALTVDGRVTWTPEDPLDVEVAAAFRLHQLGDRGFGASPGSHAAAVFADHLAVRGYGVHQATADWRIPPAAIEMVRSMVQGTAAAAAQVHPRPESVAAWQERRLEALGAVGLQVGHIDLLGLPR